MSSITDKEPAAGAYISHRRRKSAGFRPSANRETHPAKRAGWRRVGVPGGMPKPQMRWFDGFRGGR